MEGDKVEEPSAPPRRKSINKRAVRTVAVLNKDKDVDSQSESELNISKTKSIEKPCKPPPPNRTKQSHIQNDIIVDKPKTPPKKPPLPKQGSLKKLPTRPPIPKAPSTTTTASTLTSKPPAPTAPVKPPASTALVKPPALSTPLKPSTPTSTPSPPARPRTPSKPPVPKVASKISSAIMDKETIKPKPSPRRRTDRPIPVPAPRRQTSLSFSDTEEKVRTLSKTGSVDMPELSESLEESPLSESTVHTKETEVLDKLPSVKTIKNDDAQNTEQPSKEVSSELDDSEGGKKPTTIDESNGNTVYDDTLNEGETSKKSLQPFNSNLKSDENVFIEKVNAALQQQNTNTINHDEASNKQVTTNVASESIQPLKYGSKPQDADIIERQSSKETSLQPVNKRDSHAKDEESPKGPHRKVTKQTSSSARSYENVDLKKKNVYVNVPLQSDQRTESVSNVNDNEQENIYSAPPPSNGGIVEENIYSAPPSSMAENIYSAPPSNEEENIYSAPPSSVKTKFFQDIEKSLVDSSSGEGFYDAPPSTHTLQNVHINTGDEGIYASPPSATLMTAGNENFRFGQEALDLRSNRTPLNLHNMNGFSRAGINSASPVSASNKPVVPYSGLRIDDATIYSNLDGQEEPSEENVYSAPNLTPVSSNFTPPMPFNDMKRGLGDILRTSQSQMQRTSKDSTTLDDGENHKVPNPSSTFVERSSFNKRFSSGSASQRDSSSSGRYEDMVGGITPPSRPSSDYESIFPPNSPIKADIQKRTLPPRPPMPRTMQKVADEEDEAASEETEFQPNLYQSVASLRRGETALQREDLSSDSDSDSDTGYASPVEKISELEDKNKLFYIAYEILKTEKSFVEALSLICDDFGIPLKSAMEKNPRLLQEGAYNQIFMNVELIYELDKKFLHDLEERMENWEMHKRIGDLVREYCHFLKMYTTYIKGYDNAMALYHECINSNMKFSQLVKDFEKTKKAKNLKLTSYLLKPIQRIPSYRLLLKDYLKHLPDDSIDFNDIKDSVATVSEVANHINESMKEGEKFQEVLRIQSQIVNANDIIKPGRFLLKEGILMKLSRKELQQRTFILFTDSLLYCTHLGHGQLKLILELPLAGMLVQYPDSQELSTEFSVISTKRSFMLNASSPKEREDWVAALQDAIGVVNRKLGTFTIKRTNDDNLTSQHNRSDIGVIAPPWIPDSRVTMCQVCTVQFNVYNRRHHCRGCGKVVCKSCSSFEAPLNYMENESARVCEKCYETLLENVKSMDEESMSQLLPKFKETKMKKKPKKRVEALPSTLTEVEAQAEGIENSGFLRLKRGNKKEKRCWFVLKEHVLYLYKAASDPAASTTIPILGYQLDITGKWDANDFGFQLSHAGVKDNLNFHAENRSSAERWVHCFCKATALLNT